MTILPLSKLHVDGSFNENSVGVCVLLISLEGHQIHYALGFRFKAYNNEAEYKGLLSRLRLAKEVKQSSIYPHF